MNIKFEQIRVITPDVNKCLKISQNGKVLMYMKSPYYDLPHYNYNVEEVPIEEGEHFMKKANNKVKGFIHKIKTHVK